MPFTAALAALADSGIARQAMGVGVKASGRELEIRLVQARDEAARLPALLDIALEHAAAFRNLEGLRAAREALEIARRHHDGLGVGRSLSVATLCHYQRADYVAAVATGIDAIEAYADGDIAGRSRACQSIALALFSVEAFDLAEAMARRAVEDARAAADHEREAYASVVFGMILADRGAFNSARRQFRVAAAYYRGAQDVVRLKKATAHLGHTYRKQGCAYERAGRNGHARLYWTQALRVYRIAFAAARHDADDATILGSMAECGCHLENFEEAFADVSRGIELAHRGGNARALAYCQLWEGYILKEMDELAAAEAALERACESAGPLEHDPILATCLRELATLVGTRGQGERAAQIAARGESAARERESFLARVREELGPLWRRYTERGLGAAPEAA
jgi:tetratricopeptide (TPR) repeat protein